MKELIQTPIFEDREIATKKEPENPIQELGKSAENEYSGENDKYLVMSPEDIEDYKVFVKEKIEKWEKDKPDVVMLCQTSAVPLGWCLKNGFKNAFPDEKPPRFYFIDPRMISYDSKCGNIYNILKDDANIQDGKVSHTKDAEDIIGYRINEFIKYWNNKDINPDSKVIVIDELESAASPYRVVELFKLLGIKNVTNDSGSPKNYYNRNYLRNYIAGGTNYAGTPLELCYVKPTRKEFGEQRNFSGTIEKDPELKKRAMAYIHDLKKLGREAGLELKKI